MEKQYHESSVVIAVGPAKAAHASGLSLTRVKALIATGEWPSFKDGRRRLIPVAVIEGWVARKLDQV